MSPDRTPTPSASDTESNVVSRGTVLIVDDNPSIATMLRALLELRGFSAESVTRVSDVQAAFERLAPEAVVLDFAMPEANGLTVLTALRQRDPSTTIVLLSGEVDVPTTVRALRAGAEDVQTKPVNIDLLTAALERGLARTRLLRNHRVLETTVVDPYGLLDNSEPMQRLLRVVERLANATTPVLIAGEAGTGKRAIAELLHCTSRRIGKPFASVHCGSRDSARVERLLLGWTDVSASHQAVHEGALRATRGGTLVLEEPSQLTARVQEALFVASNAANHAPSDGATLDVRLVTTTRRDLAEDARKGSMRVDLYQRLAAIPLVVPPLRVRGAEAIRLLAERFLHAHASEIGEGPRRFTDAALQELAVEHWPGNSRQLRMVVEEAFALALDLDAIDVEQLRSVFARRGLAGVGSDVADDRSLKSIERLHIARVLAMTGGHRSETAKLLGITRTTLYKKISDYGLDASANS